MKAATGHLCFCASARFARAGAIKPTLAAQPGNEIAKQIDAQRPAGADVRLDAMIAACLDFRGT
ncbi:hypothetical protein [Terricaulis sp.]|uniref:hypothetical protein n=1 Tax=Terricaulis sp. TaxID=2768686 RepID=UPI002AC66689|nr:hypothetical protein [Terricaulis sp.]MDZ4689883.1 hypothetical protein [Terricaulis sp.]